MAAPKNIVIASIGTRGDLQPYCVVGAALVARGHHVTIATEERMESFVTTEFNLPVRRIVGDMLGGLLDPTFQHRFGTAPVIQCFQLMQEWNARFDQQEILASYVTALTGADIVISGPLAMMESYCVAEAIGATWVPLFLGHFHFPTSEFPQWMLENVTGNWWGGLNKWSHSIILSLGWKRERAMVNEWRAKSLHLPPMTMPLMNSMVAHDNIVMYQACSVLFAGPKRRVPLMQEWNARFDQQEILASYVTALTGADIVISGPVAMIESYCVAEAIGATWVPLFLGHFHFPTSEFPQWMLENVTGNWWGGLNKWSHSIIVSLGWKKDQARFNEWRAKSLRSPPLTMPVMNSMLAHDNIVMYQACSVLFAGPKRRVPVDYPPGKVVYTGFVFPYTPQPEPEPLKVFLSQSSVPVIYVGFGSMPTLESLELLQFVIDVCKMTGTRCVLAAGWSSLDQSSCKVLADKHADLLYVELGSISHVWLFPQMSCIVHHAGLGTSGAALRSGVPQVPCPKFVDQFHNSKVLVQLGVAPCAISKKKMTVSHVANAIQRVLRNENDVQGTARTLGEFVTKESHDGFPRLCDMILATKPTFAKKETTT
ncbi:hypothetical protein H310_10870 [Aphanomyces invadans]|uniref:Uncharacterized protein n=1 Tax=Aphanomyces invadans TaxID=157072 RepID=A0A024TNV9_9STRA|nr:hypothetical protein H310_10870 [Aphanomyces invadans]ETV95825.1 hypothetical protein H310_10870 [Aphanomyces invadans]|eukprot:XP_008875576.1 hypothetical protein H310_10870 [Aphanomyces invadans]